MTLTAELNQKAKAILFRELVPVDYPYAGFTFHRIRIPCGHENTGNRH